MTRAALEEEGTDRVEIGALVDRKVEQTGRLGGEVACRADQLLADGAVEAGAPRQPEVDQLRPELRVLVADQHVGRLDVAVQHPAVVDHLEAVEEVDGQAEHVVQPDGPLVETGPKRPALQTPLHEVEEASLGATGDQRTGGDVEALEDVGLVLQPHADRAGEALGHHGLEDHRQPVGGVRGGIGGDPAPLLHEVVEAEPADRPQLGWERRGLGRHQGLRGRRPPTVGERARCGSLAPVRRDRHHTHLLRVFDR